MTTTTTSPMVFLVLVKTKTRGLIRRIDSVHASFNNAATRLRTIYLAPDELAEVAGKALLDADKLTDPNVATAIAALLT